MRIAPCRTYHSRTDRATLLRMPDGRSAFKVYYISIIGRDEPARYEWPLCDISPEAFETQLLASGVQGVGFVTAFPHITKLFRFSPGMETVLNVRALHTRDLAPMSLARDDGDVEFACYAEAAIAADEYHAWARATDVETYLAQRSDFVDGPIASHHKLADHFGA